MAKSSMLEFYDRLRDATEALANIECVAIRARSEVVQARAAANKAIAQSRQSIAEANRLLAVDRNRPLHMSSGHESTWTTVIHS